ncbi:zinc ribbon domain-containing protein [Vibrio lentus]
MQEQLGIDLSVFDNSEYEERADYLSQAQLSGWTADSKHFQHIQKKLIQVGAKLITGPRGTGKTHQMRCAYETCLNNDQLPLPIYVTFNHYLRLETYLHDRTNAIDIFHAWVLCKISHSIMTEFEVYYDDDCLQMGNIDRFIKDMERNLYSEEYDDIISTINISQTQDLIYKAISEKGRKRAVLLMDDAALTLTHDYMVEFFDIFRSIKSIKISPKASVYPGTTQYGPRFHLGQDAEEVPIWIDVQSSDYISFMSSIIDKRFKDKIEIDENILKLLMYASFGIPRTYISMIRSFVESDKSSVQQKVNSVIQEKCTNMITEYSSIAGKIKQYSNFINVGNELIVEIVKVIKEHNYLKFDEKGAEEYKKTIIIGITDIDKNAQRMIKFLIEAGLLYEMENVSHGQDRDIRRFVPHLSLLIRDKALVKSRGFNAGQLVSILTSSSEKHPLRRKFDRILPQEAISNIKLDLPVCTNCGTARIADGQKFCHICGQELVDGSIFKECMTKNLSELPFTNFQHKVIELSKFITIEDVLISDDAIVELKSVHYVGPKYAEKIINKINSWTNEFLY